MSKSHSKLNVSDFFALIKLIKPQYLYLVLGTLFGAIAVSLQLLVPLLAKDLLNHIPNGVNFHLLLIVGILFAFSIFLGAISGSLLGIFGEDVVYLLRERLWQKSLSLPIPYLDINQSGQIASRITNDSTQVKNLLADSLPRMATSILQLVGALILMLLMDWKMTLIMFITIPLMLLILLPIFRLSSSIARKRQDSLATLNGRISEVLNNARLVKSSTASELEKNNGSNHMKTLYQLGIKEAIYDSIIGPTTGVMMLALIVAILAYGIYRISLGTMTMGTLMAFLMYMIQLIVPFTTVGQFVTEVAKASGSTMKIQELLAVPEENTVAGQQIDLTGKSLNMQNVSFSYDDSQEVLHGISFTAEPNEVVAFVGPSGSGKSTIFSLLERFYQPNSGEITLGGTTKLEDINIINWRNQLGLVGQGADIMSGSIRYNLTYGLNKTVNDNELWNALELASAKKFVEALPDKLETHIDENGANISGGQRQRLTIARAFIRDPKILMLDEATASLDPESEAMVQSALKKLMHKRTTLVIAHRINTIIDADKIYFIENGQISGYGTHEYLLEHHPLYRQYFENQIKKSESPIQNLE
ncbi:ABC transporter ATP-binding protein [Lentilactobacillus sp. SPB1-3]|uniref:ABC transporter ATP-binding protein n=1 Tax=Lentilactobacillus terminaliae TaxID=3003483 RepID=A0ACD5DG02_9LACO|nr:ABC transporter ATP-binding protein [Lentilactobacillus sp. SPB1-3]MCZ0976617.1 ABC transporter ATP-binding protein [Lentilactobacillus sp. SPB1-3]